MALIRNSTVVIDAEAGLMAQYGVNYIPPEFREGPDFSPVADTPAEQERLKMLLAAHGVDNPGAAYGRGIPKDLPRVPTLAGFLDAESLGPAISVPGSDSMPWDLSDFAGSDDLDLPSDDGWAEPEPAQASKPPIGELPSLDGWTDIGTPSLDGWVDDLPTGYVTPPPPPMPKQVKAPKMVRQLAPPQAVARAGRAEHAEQVRPALEGKPKIPLQYLPPLDPEPKPVIDWDTLLIGDDPAEKVRWEKRWPDIKKEHLKVQQTKAYTEWTEAWKAQRQRAADRARKAALAALTQPPEEPIVIRKLVPAHPPLPGSVEVKPLTLVSVPETRAKSSRVDFAPAADGLPEVSWEDSVTVGGVKVRYVDVVEGEYAGRKYVLADMLAVLGNANALRWSQPGEDPFTVWVVNADGPNRARMQAVSLSILLKTMFNTRGFNAETVREAFAGEASKWVK
jgi:hypothetical protein